MMKRLHQVVVLCELADRMDEKGSWCGETHLQKATYFLQELLKVPTGFDFMLYKYGPLSFDLRDELAGMRADGFLELSVRPHPYGPSLVPTDLSRKLRERFPKTRGRYAQQIRFVAEQLAEEGTIGLEKLATALLVTFEGDGDATVEDRARRIHELKPHVSVTDAKDSIVRADRIVERAAELGAA